MSDKPIDQPYNHVFGSIKTPKDFLSIPGYLSQVDFSNESTRRLHEMIDGYDFAKIDEYPCGIKGCATKHQHGYLVVTTDGIITNIGNRCGKKYLDLDFTRVKKSYLAKRKASNNLESLKKIRSEYASIKQTIDRLRKSFEKFSESQKILYRSVQTQLWQAMHMGRQGSRDIRRTRRMSKREASIHYAQTNTHSKDYEGRRPSIDEVVGRLDGVSVFKEEPLEFLKSEISAPLTALMSISDFSFDFLSEKDLENHSRSANKAIRQLNKADALENQGYRFYNPGNLALLELMGADKNTLLEAINKVSLLMENSSSAPD